MAIYSQFQQTHPRFHLRHIFSAGSRGKNKIKKSPQDDRRVDSATWGKKRNTNAKSNENCPRIPQNNEKMVENRKTSGKKSGKFGWNRNFSRVGRQVVEFFGFAAVFWVMPGFSQKVGVRRRLFHCIMNTVKPNLNWTVFCIIYRYVGRIIFRK